MAIIGSLDQHDCIAYSVLLTSLRSVYNSKSPPGILEIITDYASPYIEHIVFIQYNNYFLISDGNILHKLDVSENQIQNKFRNPSSIVCSKEGIYIFGGIDNIATNIVEFYDLKERKWQIIAHLPFSRLSCVALLLENKIYVMGGGTQQPNNSINNQYLTSCMVFDIKSRSWEDPASSSFQDMIYNSNGNTIEIIHNHCMYIEEKKYGIPTKSHKFDFSTNKWEIIPVDIKGYHSRYIIINNELCIICLRYSEPLLY